MKTNVIIVLHRGIVSRTEVVLNDETARAVYISMAEKLLGDDIEGLNTHDDYFPMEVDKLLEYSGFDLVWLTDIDVNEYKC
jgi:hypothetical protein